MVIALVIHSQETNRELTVVYFETTVDVYFSWIFQILPRKMQQRDCNSFESGLINFQLSNVIGWIDVEMWKCHKLLICSAATECFFWSKKVNATYSVACFYVSAPVNSNFDNMRNNTVSFKYSLQHFCWRGIKNHLSMHVTVCVYVCICLWGHALLML